MKPHRRVFSTFFLAAALVPAAIAATAGDAHAQFGTGGATGTTGTLSSTDMFASVQKVEDTNLNARDQARYLNHAHCICEDPVWLKVIVLPAASPRALAIDSTATVSGFVGASCDQPTLRPLCKNLGSMQMSQFRVSGFKAKTTVKELASYRIIGSTVGGTGGATGTGGAGSAGTGGAGGTGGATVTTPTGDVCDVQFTQTFWLFIGTAGEGDGTLGGTTMSMLMDVQPPPAPQLAAPGPAQQALMLNWPALSSSDVSDLLGYQVLCTRGDSTQVFKTGTFEPAFDSCVTEVNGDPNVPWPRPQGAFVCSDLLSQSSNEYRLKILENDVQYNVAVAAIDKQGNASIVTPQLGMPKLTQDFYYLYRHGDPQGDAVGGFCAVADGRSTTLGAVGGVGLVVALGLVARARTGRRSRRQS